VVDDEPFIAAWETWAEYAASTENLVHLSHKGISWALQVPELYRVLEKDDETIQRAEWEADQARPEVEAGFPTLHAHTLLGLCGAFESFIEDVVVARLVQEPSLLESEPFERLKVPVAMVALTDPLVRSRRIVQEASRATNADMGVGATRYERLLDLVSLSGLVPQRLRGALFQATEIRNVWAHRGGVADERFVDRCPDLGFQVGQKVNIEAKTFMPIMHGFHMYGVVIANRYVDLRGRNRMTDECPGYEGVLREVPSATTAVGDAAVASE
jgi:hypothetical protein